MYTVDRIEENIVILENRNNNKIIEVRKHRRRRAWKREI